MALFPRPSFWHRAALKFLEATVLIRDIARRALRYAEAHEIVLLAVACGICTGALIVGYWGFLLTQLAHLSRTILDGARLHPRISHSLHVAIEAIPDLAFVLLAIAGLSYLMPEAMEKIEGNKTLRICAFVVFVMFGGAAVIMNAVNREEQKRRELEHTSIERESNDRMYKVQQSVSNLQNQFIESRGKTNDFDRRKGILESLRAEYVLSHKDAPVSMITGNQYPPPEWMSKRLKQMGEAWPYVPPPPTQAVIPQPPALDPPSVNMAVAVGNDRAEHEQLFGNNQREMWFEQARRCLPPLKCYVDFDFPSRSIELHVGPKGWARMFFQIYNTGGSTLTNPFISINLAKGHGVSINRAGNHPALGDNNAIVLEFRPPMDISALVPYKTSHTGYEYTADLMVDRTIGHFTLGVRIYGDNMEAHFFLIRVDVISEDSD